MSAAPGQPVPAACGDWAATKAAYRFFDNPRVTEHGMLAGHFAATAVRCAASEGPILILQDTTEFIYSRAQPGKIGFTKTINAGRYKAGQPNVVTLCGVLMHSSLAVTLSGTPLGLTAAKFWTRTKFKGTWTLKRHVNPTRVPIETKESYRWLENLRQSMALVGAPERCVHVADRESDIYELFCLAQDLGTRFLVRVQTNRLAGTPADAEPRDGAHRVFAQLSATPWAGTPLRRDRTGCRRALRRSNRPGGGNSRPRLDRLAGHGGHTIATEMEETSVKGLHYVVVRNDKGETTKAALEMQFKRIAVLPPIGKQKHYSALDLTISMPPNAVRQRAVKQLSGSSLKTWPSAIAPKQSRRSTGTPCGGKSRCSTRSCNRAARRKTQNSGPRSDLPI